MSEKEYLIRALKDAVEDEMCAGVTETYRVGRSGTYGSGQPGPGVLENLEKKVRGCLKCGLASDRTNVVFGEGNPEADLMFVGEAPGRDEDVKGRPFVGRAGQLLTRIIVSMGLDREDVFIANILKCRPPGNRNPSPGEIDLCVPYLLEQIEIIKPGVIVALGKFASQALLKTEVPISALRGKFHDYHGVKLMPTYHPAYLLRNPVGKKDVWEDMKAVAAELGIKIPTPEKNKN